MCYQPRDQTQNGIQPSPWYATIWECWSMYVAAMYVHPHSLLRVALLIFLMNNSLPCKCSCSCVWFHHRYIDLCIDLLSWPWYLLWLPPPSEQARHRRQALSLIPRTLILQRWIAFSTPTVNVCLHLPPVICWPLGRQNTNTPWRQAWQSDISKVGS